MNFTVYKGFINYKYILAFDTKEDFKKYFLYEYFMDKNKNISIEDFIIEGNSDLEITTVLNVIDEIGIDNIFFEDRTDGKDDYFDNQITTFFVKKGVKLTKNLGCLIKNSSEFSEEEANITITKKLYFENNKCIKEEDIKNEFSYKLFEIWFD